MKALGIILWIVVPTAIYFWRAGLIGNNPLREGQPLVRWANAENIPFCLLTAVKVYLFWLVAVYMLIKAFTGRSTSSPWTAMATVDGKGVFQVKRTRGWGAGLTQGSSSGASTPTVITSSPAPRPTSAATTQSSSAAVPEPAPAFGGTAVDPEPPASMPAANTRTPSSPEPANVTQAAAPASVASSEEEMTKEMAYSLAALCEEASRLYDECIEKADNSDKARAMSQTEYVNGVQQHPISKQTFANMADRLEGELTSLLQELHHLSARGRRMWSDFLFLAGGSNSDLQTAMKWCADHRIDGNIFSTIAVKGLFLRCDFGLTMASFLHENERLNDVLSQP